MIKNSNQDFRTPPIYYLEQGVPMSKSEQKDYYVRDYVSELHKMGLKGEGVTVIIADTGIDGSHPDLEGVLIGGKNYTSDDEKDFMDRNFHGTFCAGIVSANENEVGVIGVAPKSKLYAAKVLSDSGSGSFLGILKFIEDLKSIDIEGNIIVNMSLGSSFDFPPLRDAVQELSEIENILLVGAAGNSGERRGEIDYPARYEEFLAVGAVDSNMIVAPFSSRGNEGDIMGAGVSVLSTYIGGKYARASGTSFSTPHVSGVAALIWSKFPKLTAKQIRESLESTAIDKGKDGFDNIYFGGIVNPIQAYQAARKMAGDDNNGGGGDGDALKAKLVVSSDRKGVQIQFEKPIDWDISKSK